MQILCVHHFEMQLTARLRILRETSRSTTRQVKFEAKLPVHELSLEVKLSRIPSADELLVQSTIFSL